MISLKKIFFGLTAVCLLLLPACTEPMFEGDKGGINDTSALTLSLTVDGMGLQTATRVAVAAEEGEETVNTVHLFFFEPSTDGTGAFVDVIELLDVNNALNNTINIPTDESDISASNAYRIIGVANAGEIFTKTDENDWIGKTEADFRQSAITNIANATDFKNKISSSNLLMNGSATKAAGNGLIEMKLTRNMARVDVIYNGPNDITFNSAQLYHVYENTSITGDVTSLKYTSDVERKWISKEVNPISKAVKGKLYAFENRVTNPTRKDNITTCVIVKFCCSNNNATEGYFRININPEGESQYLKRNNVYVVTINKVSETMHATIQDALDNTDEKDIEYTINNWDLGDNGLIVSDSYSILALPVKKALIGVDGTVLTTYDITTFSTLESPTPLTISSKTLDAGLTADLEGNKLKITATALGTTPMREGKVTFTYAGLEATMDIEQSPKTNAFLKLSYQQGWSGLFSSSGGETSKEIYVNASGPWKAEVIGADKIFSLKPGEYLGEISSITHSNNTFQVSTLQPNLLNIRRNAFVVVTLDADPLNCVGVVSLAQTSVSKINILPAVETITFNGSKSVPQSNTFSYTNIYCNEDYLDIVDGEEVTKSKRVEVFATISNIGDADFTCNLTGNETFGYALTVSTNVANYSNKNYEGKLTLHTAGNASVMEIKLIQTPLGISVTPIGKTEVGPEGGKTDPFNLSIGDNDATCKVSITYRGVEREIYNHGVKLVYASGANAGQEVNPNTFIPASTQLQVDFSKVYFPNRETNIQAIVTFETNAGAKASYTFNQRKLASKGVNIWNLRGNHYGSLSGSHYISNYRDAIRAYPGTFTNNTSNTLPANYPSNISYIHIGNQFPSGYNWGAVESFIKNEEGITVLTNDDGGTSLAKGNQLLSGLGYQSVYSGTTPSIRVESNVSDSRVGKFLTTEAKTKLTSSVTGFYANTICSYISKSASSNFGTNGSGVAIMTGSNSNQVYLMIDPKQRFVYIGEIEVFNSSVSGDRRIFMLNFAEFIANAAKYGSHFTDMLIDGSAIKEPWHADWGTNKWPTRSN